MFAGGWAEPIIEQVGQVNPKTREIGGTGSNMSETLHKGRVFSVERRTITEPGDVTVVRDVVVHPGAVVILPIIDDQRLAILHHYRRSVGEELIELPAGTRETGEEPIETAARELEEETGYKCGSIEPFVDFYTTPGFCNEYIHTFVARDLSDGQRLDGTERIRVEIVTWDEVRDAIDANRIRDAKTIAVLGAYLLRNNR